MLKQKHTVIPTNTYKLCKLYPDTEGKKQAKPHELNIYNHNKKRAKQGKQGKHDSLFLNLCWAGKMGNIIHFFAIVLYIIQFGLSSKRLHALGTVVQNCAVMCIACGVYKYMLTYHWCISCIILSLDTKEIFEEKIKYRENKIMYHYPNNYNAYDGTSCKQKTTSSGDHIKSRQRRQKKPTIGLTQILMHTDNILLLFFWHKLNLAATSASWKAGSTRW